jgi:hypothetical protein
LIRAQRVFENTTEDASFEILRYGRTRHVWFYKRADVNCGATLPQVWQHRDRRVRRGGTVLECWARRFPLEPVEQSKV